MATDISSFFDKYEWSCEQVDTQIWRASLSAGAATATEREEDFDLYVASGEDWIHFAISPLTPPPEPACAPQLQRTLLQLNQQIRLARLAIDEDGDVNLLADLPAASLDYPMFATVIDTLVHYAQRLGHELARTATEPGYHSPLSGAGSARTVHGKGR